MKKLLCLTILIALLFVIGCTYHYKATMYPIPPATVPDFKGTNTVSIVNCCTQKEPILMEKLGGEKYFVNLVQATDIAVQVLEDELLKKGFRITEAGEKKIKLTVENVTYSRTYYLYFYLFRATTTLLVETGDGYKKRYNGYNKGGDMSVPYRACDGSITRAVASMLNDPNIINYITEREKLTYSEPSTSKKEPKHLEPPEKSHQREISCADGSKYVGSIVNGKKHGQGTYTWPTGAKYIGEWKEGKIHGNGTYIWPNGDKYVGEWKDNRATGGWLSKTTGSKAWVYQNTGGKWIIKGQ